MMTTSGTRFDKLLNKQRINQRGCKFRSSEYSFFKSPSMAKAVHLFALKVLIILIFAGWVSVWLLKPTTLWTRKWKEAENTARPTVFGYYGLNFTVYTFPIIAIAIIGFVYLSLKPWWPRNRQSRVLTARSLSNPLVINSPLGILSGIEILSASLFIFFLAWTFYVRISNDYKKMKPDKLLKLNEWQFKYFRVATRFGLLAEACLALLLLPILRGMALFRLLGIQFEASVKYHIWLGTSMILFATFHGASTLFIWGIKRHIQDMMWKWQKTGRIYLAGEITLVTGLVIWITSLPQIRRKRFEIFYYTHHLYIVFLVFFLFHTGDRHFYMIFPGVFLFGIDKILRIIQSRPETCLVSARIFPNKAIELTLPKDPRLKYAPTSVVFMKIPSISKFQWHSFSVTSSSIDNDQTMSVIIKCEGWWTSALHTMIRGQLRSHSDQLKCIPVAIEGPYGPASLDFLRYDRLLLVAGGIGITPFLSILQELALAKSSSSYRFATRMQLIYVVRKTDDISILNSISHLLLSQPAKEWHIKVKVFVTQEEERTDETIGELLNKFSELQPTVEFDTKLCSNFYAIHGLESLLWMAALAGLSSILFLILLSGFNHAFIPKEKNAMKQKTPSSVSDVLLVCSFIVTMMCTCLVAIVLRWKRLRRSNIPPVDQRQGKATSSMDTKLAGGALQEHEIHFGGRPNFQDVFSDFTNESGGSNIGVLVCGPESMKESVASSCRRNSPGGFKMKMKMKKQQQPCFNFHSLNFTL